MGKKVKRIKKNEERIVKNNLRIGIGIGVGINKR